MNVRTGVHAYVRTVRTHTLRTVRAVRTQSVRTVGTRVRTHAHAHCARMRKSGGYI